MPKPTNQRSKLIALAVLVTVGAFVWIQYGDQLAAQLSAQVKAPKEPQLQCKPDSKEHDTGKIVFSGFIVSQTQEEAKTKGVNEAVAYINARLFKSYDKKTGQVTKDKDCTLVYTVGTSIPITEGKVTVTGEISVPAALRESLKCNHNDSLPKAQQCTTRCEKLDTQCTPTTKVANCTITKPPGAKYAKVVGKKRVQGHDLEVTCSVTVEVKAQCSCNAGCYAARKNISVGGKDYALLDDDVACVCAPGKSSAESAKRATDNCPTLMREACKPDDMIYKDGEVPKPAPGWAGEDDPTWSVQGKCVPKDVSITPSPTTTFTSVPVPTGAATPTPTPACSWWTSWFGCGPTPTPTPTYLPPSYYAPTPTPTPTYTFAPTSPAV